MAPEKEVHFFDHHYREGEEWYRQRFSGVSRETAIGEATPNYLYDESAIDRMSQVIPEARLIATVRNPVDRAYSHFWLAKSRGGEPLETFADAVDAESGRLANGSDRERLTHSYLDRVRYLRQFQRVTQRYDRDRLLVVLFDDVRDRPEAVYREICGFIGVDQDFLPRRLGEQINQHAELRSEFVTRIGKRLPRFLAKVAGKLNRRETAYPPMDPAVREHLCESFATENEAFGEWLGRDLSGWSV